MLPKAVEEKIILFLAEKTGRDVFISGAKPISGGSINEVYQVSTSAGTFCLKINELSRFPGMFEKEARGLALLRAANEIYIPEPYIAGEADDYAFLLMEFVEPSPPVDDFWEIFGQSLAALHRHTSAQFGLDYDNYMGSLYQHNNPHDNWTAFFIHERLERQVKLAVDSRMIESSEIALFDRLYKRLDMLLPTASPSLVHGDLWCGNFMTGSHGMPCLIDPAVYYGHPEIDIAMTTLFGGFKKEFYEAYIHHHPHEPGWGERLDIYNLYPLLVHVNLFGGGYWEQVRRILKRFT